SMLPDVIDKPLALLFLTDDIESLTRNIGHSLLFTVVLFFLWQIISGRRRNFLLPLSIGSALHLLLDGTFTNPNNLFWPFLGWEFSHAGRVDELFSGLPYSWSLPWNISWLMFSEALGALFILRTLVVERLVNRYRVRRPKLQEHVTKRT
ncbi:MAG: metal-dependent hydrolase, partial [Chloroflexi bacterium]|nr:metal-dependent hydrolase [Chloroflexota bacterium]